MIQFEISLNGVKRMKVDRSPRGSSTAISPLSSLQPDPKTNLATLKCKRNRQAVITKSQFRCRKRESEIQQDFDPRVRSLLHCV